MQFLRLSYRTRKLKTSTITLMIFGIIFPIIGLGLCLATLGPVASPIDISTISPEEMVEDTVYKVDELFVADLYAEYTENERFTNRVVKVDNQCFLCMLVTDEEFYTVSVQTKPDDDVMTAINAYLEDCEQYLGDLAIGGYFKANALAGELLTYYDEAVEIYSGHDLEATPLYIDLVYECGSDTDYFAYVREQHMQQRVISLVFTGIGIFCLIFSAVARKFYKKQLAAEAEKARAWTTEEE